MPPCCATNTGKGKHPSECGHVQRFGADQFDLRSKSYQLYVGYFLRHVGIAPLSHTRSTALIDPLKYCFGLHDIREVLILDNWAQLYGHAFNYFADVYWFRHVTSGSRFLQINHNTKWEVQTVKNLPKRSGDPRLGSVCLETTSL